jgi:hypothetical protein
MGIFTAYTTNVYRILHIILPIFTAYISEGLILIISDFVLYDVLSLTLKGN